MGLKKFGEWVNEGDSINEKLKIDDFGMSKVTSREMFGKPAKVKPVKVMFPDIKKGQKYIIFEPGMAEWTSYWEHYQVVGEHYFFRSTLQFDDSVLDFHYKDLATMIENGEVYEQK